MCSFGDGSMTQKMKVTLCNVTLGTEVVRIYDSRNEAMMRTNTLLIKEMNKYNTDELFVRYESYCDNGDWSENPLPF